MIGQHIGEHIRDALTERRRQGAIATYGAGLGCDCGDCPTPDPDAMVPSPRVGDAVEADERTPSGPVSEVGRGVR